MLDRVGQATDRWATGIDVWMNPFEIEAVFHDFPAQWQHHCARQAVGGVLGSERARRSGWPLPRPPASPTLCCGSFRSLHSAHPFPPRDDRSVIGRAMNLYSVGPATSNVLRAVPPRGNRFSTSCL